MKIFFSAIFFLICSTINAQSIKDITKFNYNKDFNNILAETKKSESDYYYEKQLKKFNDGSQQTDLEVLSLLIGFTANKNYHPYRDLFLDKELYDLNEEKKYVAVIEKSDEILTRNPFLIKVMIEKRYANAQLGNQPEIDSLNEKMRKIYSAMYYSSSNGGITIENSMFALHPKDGQYFIKYLAKAKIGSMGSGKDSNGNFIDILEAKLDNESVVMYFNVQHAIITMTKN